MSKAAKTEATKQKQHTQHRIIVNFHPLPFRTIVVCMGVRTLHLSCHLAPVFAPCLFLRTSSFLRTRFFDLCAICRAICQNQPCRLRQRDSSLKRRKCLWNFQTLTDPCSTTNNMTPFGKSLAGKFTHAAVSTRGL